MKRREVTFNVDLLPVIAVLSKLVVFLMAPAVWIYIGSVDVHQGLGGPSDGKNENPPTLYATFYNNEMIELKVKDAKSISKNLARVVFKINKSDEIDWVAFDKYMSQLKKSAPDVKTIMVSPSASSSYQQIVSLVDRFKSNELQQVGLIPL